MHSNKIHLDVQCRNCGEKTLAYEGTLTDTSIITCTSCGNKAGTWGDVQKDVPEKVAEAAVGEFKKELKDIFGDSLS